MVEGAKPCPFCGGTDHSPEVWNIDNDGTGNLAHIQCNDCEGRGPMSEFKYDTEDEAVADALARWNGRT